MRESFGENIEEVVGVQLSLRFLVAKVLRKVSPGDKRGAKIYSRDEKVGWSHQGVKLFGTSLCELFSLLGICYLLPLFSAIQS